MSDNELTTVESSRLSDLELVVSSGLQTFVEVGNALREIRESRLYRATHGRFEDYCDDRWGMSKRHADRLVSAAEVVYRLSGTEQTTEQNGTNWSRDPLPVTESQARELAKAPPEEQAEVWGEVVETTAKPTAKAIKGVVEERKKAKESKPEPEPEPMPTMSEDEKLARQAIAGAQPGRELLSTIRSAMKQLKALEPDRGLEMIVSRRQSIQASLQTAANAVNVYLPADVCPRCNGKGCPQCGNFGWVNKIAKQQLEK